MKENEIPTTTSVQMSLEIEGAPPETAAASEREAARHRAEQFFDQEIMCPNCPGDGSHEPSVFWSEENRQFRCTCCGWADLCLTADAEEFK